MHGRPRQRGDENAVQEVPARGRLCRRRSRDLRAGNRSTGFYRNKAKTVIACGRKLVDDFKGEVPRTVDELVTLPGVGRKTANMVRGNAFGQQAIAVDTHVLRVSNRLGLVKSEDAEEVETALAAAVPADKHTAFANAMILHGRETCTARNPRCGACVLWDLCPWPDKAPR
jgi:endonuclease III